MSLFITSLNSGSNGNCYYIGNSKEAVLIDAGISCREIEKRMSNLQLSMHLVKAIFISHEHTDHIRGLTTLAGKYKLPVYISPDTLKNSPIILDKDFIKTFEANNPVAIGQLTITAFKKLHDAIDPHSFIVEGNGIKIGVLTDIGKVCRETVRYFNQCHAAFLESNYDEQMLEQGSYPIHLKRRISGGKGHLSNHQALQFFIDYKPPFMSHLILAHLSKDNNCPELVRSLFIKHAQNTIISVASRYNETPVYHIRHTDNLLTEIKNNALPLKVIQMSLF